MILMMIMWLYKLIIGCIIVIDSPLKDYDILIVLFHEIVSHQEKYTWKKSAGCFLFGILLRIFFFGKSLCLSVHKYSKLQWSNWVDMNWHNELLATWVATVVASANNTSTTIAFSRWPEFFSICKQHCSTYQNQQKECWKTLDKIIFRALIGRF